MSEKTVHIQYFALLREQRGLANESILTNAQTPAELYQNLSQAYPFTLPQTNLQVAVNEEFASWNTPLSDGDKLVFIPPVAGG
jgi:molybdopterin converting factor subunit 1